MDYHTKKELQKCSTVLINCNDPRFNYMFSREPEKLLESKEILIPMSLYDYGVVKSKETEFELPKITPLSLASLKSLEDAELWYRMKFPDLPDEYHGIMARYSFGELLTRKDVKNSMKKYKKKKGKVPVGLSIRTASDGEKIKVVFD
tara:strand:+ start:3773 stop:4213 length:441 start_codon:yes stop_codon:yes gene_type:complete